MSTRKRTSKRKPITKYSLFPVYARDEDARCYECGGKLKDHKLTEEGKAGHGAREGRCPKCKKTGEREEKRTFYDLEKR